MNRSCILFLLLLSLNACSLGRIREKQVNRYPRPQRDNTSICPPTSPNRCAIISPLLKLGEGKKHKALIIDGGRDALEIRINLIRAATKSIEIQTFIWAVDSVGLLIFKELLDAARRGVRVRIVTDHIFSASSVNLAALTAVAHENLEVRYYNPLTLNARASWWEYLGRFLFYFSKSTHRMHNKVFIVDAKVALVGGRNIQNKYYDQDRRFNFYDRDVLVAGSVAGRMSRIFEEYWANPAVVAVDQLKDVHKKLFRGGKQRPFPSAFFLDIREFRYLLNRAVNANYIQKKFADRAHRVESIQFWSDKPNKPFLPKRKENTRVNSRLWDFLADARKSITIQTPYLVQTEKNLQKMKTLRELNPDLRVRISTNSLATTDAVHVYGLYFKKKKFFLSQLGFEIFELKKHPHDITRLNQRFFQLARVRQSKKKRLLKKYRSTGNKDLLRKFKGPGIGMHAKSAVVDGKISMIGSHNLDPRSWNINTEALLIIRGESFAKELEHKILRLTHPRNSFVVAPNRRIPYVAGLNSCITGISRRLPIFDLWPIRYAALYKLRKGKSPLPYSHPDFHHHYKKVGNFPGTGPFKSLVAWFVSVFGGATTSYM